ncbi:hypothetical protein A2501_02210 [Candidatus Uhrbacteria bacterium RIFOXYC12_FULL_57_11]|nr:MAG: hypothetical protein A2501_02210 [Candidatus Uhrbacteria bacterium RIFOXYC12_FULL_57_11]
MALDPITLKNLLFQPETLIAPSCNGGVCKVDAIVLYLENIVDTTSWRPDLLEDCNATRVHIKLDHDTIVRILTS